MKRCNRCGQIKPLSDFYCNRGNKDGKQERCKSCHLEANREWAERHPDKRRAAKRRYDLRHSRNRNQGPEAKRAHHLVEKAIASGDLTRPKVCPKCNDSRYKVHAHHDDYSRPLDVEWLCSKCHGRLHAKEKEKEGARRAV